MEPQKFITSLFEKLEKSGYSFPEFLEPKQIQIFSEQLDSLNPEEKYNLRKIVCDHYDSSAESMIKWYFDQNGVKCHFDIFSNRDVLTNISNYQTIIPKKAVAYSGTSVFTTSTLSYHENAIGFPQHFWETLLNLRILFENNIGFLLPSRIQIDDGGVHSRTTSSFRYGKLLDYKDNIYVDLASENADKLAKQLFEMGKQKFHSGILRYLYPLSMEFRLKE